MLECLRFNSVGTEEEMGRWLQILCSFLYLEYRKPHAITVATATIMLLKLCHIHFMNIFPIFPLLYAHSSEVVSNLCVRAREGWTEYGFVIGCNSMIVSWLFFVLFCFFYTMWSSSSCSIAIAWQKSSLFVCVLAVVGILLPTVTAGVYCCIWFSLQQSFCFLFLSFFAVLCACAGAKEREQEKKEGR